MARAWSAKGPTEPASEQVRRWIETPVEFWEECARNYGAFVGLDLGSLGPIVLISEPRAVLEVFQLPIDRFECHQYNEHYRYFMGDQAVLLQDGKNHRRQRQLLGAPFRHESLSSKRTSIHEIASNVLARWPAGEAFNPRRSLHEITFRSLMDLLFGETVSDAPRELVDLYREHVLPQVDASSSWGPWQRFAQMQPRIRQLLNNEIALRRGAGSTPGLLTRFAQANDASGKPLSKEQIHDHVFSMMLAGVDTTAIALTWGLYWSSREPEVLARLRDEVSSVSGGASAPEVLEHSYLRAFFFETLRMYPVVPTPSGRRLTSETALGNYIFPAGVTLLPCTYLVHRREDLYPDSSRFDPERFLQRSYGSHEYFPFGGGARICVGEMLARIEFMVTFAEIIARWDFDAADTNSVRVTRHATLLAPSHEFRIVATPRASRTSTASS